MPLRTIPISLACGDYDRTRPILDGRVTIEGCDVTTFSLPPEETFFRAFRHAEFDVAELSFSSYLITTVNGDCPYVAIPAFVSRSFRHSAIYVRGDSGISRPQDLRGRRVGVPEYQVTAAVWVRAFLEDDFDVKPADIRWVTGGVEEAGRHEKISLNLPPDVRVDPAGDGKTLSNMLIEGEIDALVCPRTPSCYGNGSGVKRLFDDPVGAAELHYRNRKVFPIMHVVGVRKTLVAEHPWLPAAVYKAFLKARELAARSLDDTTALSVSLPWLVEEVERTRSVMGPEFWPYGIEDNRITIDTLLDHHHRQGLSSRRLSIRDVFHSSTMERYKI